MAKAKIINKSNVNLHGVAPGESTIIEVDDEGTPIDINWRRRFRDAEVDNCVEVVKPKAEKPKKKETK